MTNEIIRSYLLANKLKDVLRTGWLEVKISGERIESVAEHIYGSIVLANIMNKVYELNLDMLKVINMIIDKESEKIFMAKENTPISNDSTNNDVNNNSQSEYLAEFNLGESKEAIFCKQILKIESDLQAKIYELNGNFSLENALNDVKNFGEPLASQILPNVKKPSDGWLEYNRQFYSDEIFKNLSNEIQKL